MIPTKSSSNRKYNFHHLKVGGSIRYPHEEQARVRSAVIYANKGDARFVCRVIRLANNEKRVLVQRVS